MQSRPGPHSGDNGARVERRRRSHPRPGHLGDRACPQRRGQAQGARIDGKRRPTPAPAAMARAGMGGQGAPTCGDLLGLAMLSPWLPLARLAAIGALLLFLVYWAIIARAMTFDPRPSCGCFGQIGDQRVTAKTLARNTVLLAGAAAFVWMTWAQGVTAFSFVADATTREWLLLLGAGYAVLVAWFVLSPPAPVTQRRRDRGTHADPEPPADADDEYVRVPIPDAILLDGKRDAATLLQLTQDEAVLLVFITCGCPSTHETWHPAAALGRAAPPGPGARGGDLPARRPRGPGCRGAAVLRPGRPRIRGAEDAGDVLGRPARRGRAHRRRPGPGASPRSRRSSTRSPRRSPRPSPPFRRPRPRLWTDLSCLGLSAG
jgi:hypothetical protein